MQWRVDRSGRCCICSAHDSGRLAASVEVRSGDQQQLLYCCRSRGDVVVRGRRYGRTRGSLSFDADEPWRPWYRRRNDLGHIRRTWVIRARSAPYAKLHADTAFARKQTTRTPSPWVHIVTFWFRDFLANVLDPSTAVMTFSRLPQLHVRSQWMKWQCTEASSFRTTHVLHAARTFAPCGYPKLPRQGAHMATHQSRLFTCAKPPR